MSADPYVYPGTGVLQNLLDIRDSAALDRVERQIVLQRFSEAPPAGTFDLFHLQAIHRHLFRDVYGWAGELRTVEIAKGDSHFINRQFIATAMGYVHKRLEAQDYLLGLSRQDFAAAAAQAVGDINYVHPFREGNGRTQLCYLQQLSGQAGHRLSLDRFDALTWNRASRASHQGDHEPMQAAIMQAFANR